MVLKELSQDTIKLIKSTQVITNPVSVVKELLENSLDAGATTVTIRLENHGFHLIEVRDNGSGIQDDDMKLIAKPHFTSKIFTFADLASLSTYGFRGEALASLCSVAEVSITTKTKDSLMGYTYTFGNSGNVTSKKPAAAPNGTSIIARNMFKNLPVRKHYYSTEKRRRTELRKVEDLVLAFTLAAPNIHLTLTHDKCTIIQKSPVKNIQEALMSTFPAVYKSLVLKEKKTEDIHVEAYLPASGPCDNPALSRTTPENFFIIVNRRPVFYKSIEKILKAFYSQKVQGSHGRYPLGVLSISLPIASVDINLEPNKTKIFIENEKQVLEIIQEILSELYGPLDQSKKNDDGERSGYDMSHKTDITCSLATLKDSQMLKKEICIFGQNVDSFDVSLGNEKTRETIGVYSISKGDCNNTIGQKSSCSGVLQTLITEVTNDSQGTSNGTFSQELCISKNNVLCTSISKELVHASLPTVSESDKIPSSCNSESELNDFLNDTNGNVSKTSDDILSENVPLSSTSIKESHKIEMKDVYNMKSNESKLHDHFIESDRNLIYKIPPLSLLKERKNELDIENFVCVEKGKKDMIHEKNTVEQIPVLNNDLGSIKGQKPREEGEGRIAGTWNTGMPIDGKKIQTVQLANKPSLVAKLHSEANTDQFNAMKNCKRLASLEDNNLSATSSKKSKINSSSYDGKEMKKPSSSFMLFSRDILHQVLSEHPGADFVFVAKEMAQRWKSLGQDRKDHYRDLAKAEADKYQKGVEYMTALTPYIKMERKVIQEHSLNTNKPWLQHRKYITCSLDIIKSKRRQRRSVTNHIDDLSVLGRLTSGGGWVCQQGSDIMALNVYRIYEVVLYNNILMNLKLPMKPLDDPIPFNASAVGMENWAALLKLSRELVTDHSFYCITDQRLMANGFNVCLFSGTTTNVISHGEIIQMTDAVGFYGISDLKEILSYIAASPRANLQYTRPLKLQHWIKAEAVRMVRSAPNILRKDDVIEKVKRLYLTANGSKAVNQVPVEEKCIHGKPFFTKLYSLGKLSDPKQNQHNILNSDLM